LPRRFTPRNDIFVHAKKDIMKINSSNLPIIYPVNQSSVLANTFNQTGFLSPQQLARFNQIAGTTQPIWQYIIALGLLACSPDHPARGNDGLNRDDDNDGLPNRVDECDNIPAQTANGCPVGQTPDDTCQVDTDGDGFSDCVDECPEQSHPSFDPNANGCPPDDENFVELDGGVMDQPDAELPPPLRLLEETTLTLNREEAISCPHLAYEDNPVLSWQEGVRVYLTPLNAEEVQLPDQNVDLSNISRCRLTKGLAKNDHGAGVLLLNSDNENWINISVRILDENLEDSRFLPIARIPDFNLNQDTPNTIASIEALPNGGFVVVWIDRHFVRAQLIDNEGRLKGDSFEVNDEFAPQLKSPDVTIINQDQILISWQEGNADLGPMKKAVFNLEGERIEDDSALTEDPEERGFYPKILSEGAIQLIGWINDESKGEMELNFPGMDFRLGFGAEVLNWKVSIDADYRMSLAWIENQAGQTQLKLADVGEIEDGPTAEEYLGIAIDDLDSNQGFDLIGAGERVYLVYPLLNDPTKMAIKVFGWR
jgi:hypothetical protein